MAHNAIENGAATTRPVRLIWQRSDDGGEAPALTIDHAPLRTQMFKEYGVESVTELADEALSAYHRQRRQSVRLGVVAGTGEDATYHSEAALLSRVEGIDASFAAPLIEWYDDLPSLCEEQRRQGDVLLGDLLHDARVEDRAWVDELEAFIDSLGHEETLEQRLKAANIWVEPDNVAADGV
jgi:hypothetical protein